MVTQEDGKLQLQQLTSSLTFPHGAPEVWKDLCRVRPMKGEACSKSFGKLPCSLLYHYPSSQQCATPFFSVQRTRVCGGPQPEGQELLLLHL